MTARAWLRAALYLGSCSPLACDGRIEPKLCLCDAAGCSPEQRKANDEKCGAAPSVESGAGFFVLHRLPSDVTVEEPLQLLLTTPCGETKLSAEHDADGLVELPVKAPAGSSCSLEVRASIANSTLSQSSRGADLAAACAPDALAADCAGDHGAAGAASD